VEDLDEPRDEQPHPALKVHLDDPLKVHCPYCSKTFEWSPGRAEG
jgi:uncharacterized Zn-finger protein